MKKVLIIAAHPDDEVLGLGGTIAKHTKNGDEVHLLIITDGSTSQYKKSKELSKIIDNKKKETEDCAKILGISTIIYGNLPDMKLDITPHIEINEVIENAINIIKPDIVYTHFWGDVNQDHIQVFNSTLVAVRPMVNQSVKEIYCYNVPSSTEWGSYNQFVAFSPNTFVDISKYFDIKQKAIECYKTELRNYPHPRSIECIKNYDKDCGLKVGVKMAESFVMIRNIK